MKQQLALGLATMLFGLGGSVFAGEEQGAEKPQMYAIYKEFVKPGKTEQYEAAMKRMISGFTAYQIDPEKVHWKVVSGPEIGYMFVMPIDSFAAMDESHANWMEAVEIIGAENFEEIIAPAMETMVRAEAFHVARMSHLCYTPENPRLKKEEIEYIHYGFYYALPGKQEELEAIAKEFAELYARHGIDTGWSFYKSVTGTDLPLYVVAVGAKSPTDYFTNQDRIRELIGEEAKEIAAKVGATLRKMEYKEGYVRPDLAYPQPDLTSKPSTEKEFGR
ncbi:MAG: hypothetical protein ACYTE6_08425 [Planctomycetota bacterium]|jgi:hypothetical protein